MNGGQERYWLLRQGCPKLETGERRAADFVCCEVPVGADVAMALEVFTSRESAEAELQGIRRLAPDIHHLRTSREYRGRSADGEPEGEASEGIDELLGYELVEILDDSDVSHVLIDPPPVDEPILGVLQIEHSPAFAEELRRQLLSTMRKDRV